MYIRVVREQREKRESENNQSIDLGASSHSVSSFRKIDKQVQSDELTEARNAQRRSNSSSRRRKRRQMIGGAPQVLSISSQVVFGHVGQSNTALALNKLGVEVWQLPTCVLAHVPGRR